MLNDQLDFLIRKYTLQGQNVLVHCRGGVGRAGLVACCWMLKMGLCGWIQEALLNGHAANGANGANQPQPPVMTTAQTFFHHINGHTSMPAPALPWGGPPAPPNIPTDDSHPPTRPGTPIPSAPSAAVPLPPIQRDTVDLIERVVRVVRWRRSIKAIETYEQVRFLVEFVEFLRGGSVPAPEAETVDATNVVVVNGYANGVLNGVKKENDAMADQELPIVKKVCGDQEMQGA
jgi:hypothetical protein